jgi:integrase
VNLDKGLLHIRETKFGKSRWVPLHPTAKRAMDRYANLCDKHLGTRPPTANFFVGAFGKPLPYRTVCHAFLSIRAKLGWRSSGSMKKPRIHDLRHSFACQRLLSWYRAGADVNQAILALSTYMGHAKVKYTYWYLGATVPMLSVAGDRFEQFILEKGK